MKVSLLIKLLKEFPPEALINPKMYNEGFDGVTLVIYEMTDDRKKVGRGGIDIPFQ